MGGSIGLGWLWVALGRVVERRACAWRGRAPSVEDDRSSIVEEEDAVLGVCLDCP